MPKTTKDYVSAKYIQFVNGNNPINYILPTLPLSGDCQMKYLTIFEEEQSFKKNEFAFANEAPAIKRLTANISKVLHPHHAEQGWKLVEQWKSFRKEKNIESNVVHVEHSRAAIVLKAAEQALKLKTALLDFFQNEDSSVIHKSIDFDLRSDICSYEMSACALFFVFLTDPLWKSFHGALEGGVYVKKRVHILDVIPILKSLKEHLVTLAFDGYSLVEGKTCFNRAFLEKESCSLITSLIPENDIAK